MNMVQLGIQYFPDITTGRPVSLGSVYIGVADLDPQILANQLPVSLKLEDGSFVSVGQPLLTGAGGVVLYDGSPAQIFVAGNHSIKVLNSSGSQVYYIPNNNEVFVASDISLRDTTLLAMDDFDRSILFTDGDGFTAGAGPHVFTVTGDYTPTDSDFRTYKMDVNGVITTIVVTGQTGTQFTYAGTLAATDTIFVGDDANRPLSLLPISTDAVQEVYTKAEALSVANNLQEIEDAGASAQLEARGNLGLPDYEEISPTALDGGFIVGDFEAVRTGNQITISCSPFGHSSSTSVVSDSGVIPSDFRPNETARNTFTSIGGIESTITVSTSGTVTVTYSSAQIASDGATIGYVA